MITYIDSNNKQDYTVLFEKASAKLGLVPIIKEVEVEVENEETHEIELVKQTQYWKRIQENGEWSEVQLDPEVAADKAFIEGETSKGISSLNEYFQHIEDLAALAIGNGRSGSDPYFLRVPVDEPYFEINANTRAITVPAALRQVGVIGDKFAEIVFFKIDRYFDAIDLDTRQIYIEWETPDGKKGVSRDFLRDTQSEKDKIIFGWIIGDELTEAVGTIRFAVRFVEWNHGADANEDVAISGTELAYSFSSLPAQITVVDSLHYDLFEDSEQAAMIPTDDQAGTILFFLQNSNPDSPDESTPEVAGIPVFKIDLADTANIGEGMGNTLRLQVEAVSTEDSGTISYMFGKKATEDGGTTGIVAKIDFIEVDTSNPATLDAQKTYYIKKANGVFEVVALSAIEANDEVYEKVAYIMAAGPGYYFAKARNTVLGKKTSEATSNVLYIPYAEAPEIETPIPAHFVLNRQYQTLGVDTTYNQADPTVLNPNTNIFIDEGDTGAAGITLGEEVGPEFVTPLPYGTIAYEWFHKATEADEWESINTNTDHLAVTAPGFYGLKVTNTANNDTAELKIEDIQVLEVIDMITMPASAVDWDNFVADLQRGVANPTLKVHELDEPGTISYQWHMITRADGTDFDLATSTDMENPNGVLHFNNGVAEIPFKPKREGTYFIELIHEVFADDDDNKAKAILLGADRDGATLGLINIAVQDTYKALYEFVAAEGTLPETGMPAVPVDNNEYLDHSTVARIAEATPFQDVVVEGGKWVFQSWDADSKTINSADITFIGTWAFVVNVKYHATYRFEKANEELPDLPNEVLSLLPVDNTEYDDQATVNSITPAETTVVVNDGGLTDYDWTFEGWDAESKVINGADVVFVGTWSRELHDIG